MSTRSVLIFDRDHHSGSTLRNLLNTWGYNPVVSDDIPAALQLIDKLHPAFVIDSGSTHDFAFVRQVRAYDENLPVVLLAEQGSVEGAVQALQEERVYYYFEKPIDPDKLHHVLDRALELGQAKRENELLKRELQDRGAYGELVGTSDSIRKVYTLIEQVAPSSASVLITGESGTGKELVARTIHKMSPRRDKPFVAINCSAIP